MVSFSRALRLMPLLVFLAYGLRPMACCGQGENQVLIVAGKPVVNIESLTDPQTGYKVRAIGDEWLGISKVEQGAANSRAINAYFLALQNGGQEATRFHPLYVPAKSFAVGPKIFATWGYGGVGLYGAGAVVGGGSVWDSSTTNAMSALIKVSHFDEPILQIPGIGFEVSGLTLAGWHQDSSASTIPGKRIINATNATPIVVTTGDTSGNPQPHGLADGDFIRVYGVRGNWTANSTYKAYNDPRGDGRWRIRVVDENTFELWGEAQWLDEEWRISNPSSGRGDYIARGTGVGESGGFWVWPGSSLIRLKLQDQDQGMYASLSETRGLYAEVGIDLVRGGDWTGDGATFQPNNNGGSPGHETVIDNVAIWGCEQGIRVSGTNNADSNTVRKLAVFAYGSCVKWENYNNTVFHVGMLSAVLQHHLLSTADEFVVRSPDNVFNFGNWEDFDFNLDIISDQGSSGGLLADQVNFVDTTLLRTRTPSHSNGRFIIQNARPDFKSWWNRMLVMESAADAHYRIGYQYADHGKFATEPLVRTMLSTNAAGLGFVRNADVQIDAHGWRRDQELGYPVRPVPALPVPIHYTTQAFPSTKLWIDASDEASITANDGYELADPRDNLRRISTIHDKSGTGNDLGLATEEVGNGPGLLAETFNSRPTFLVDTVNYLSDVGEGTGFVQYRGLATVDGSGDPVEPTGLDDVDDLEIMFPFIYTGPVDVNDRVLLSSGGADASMSWRVWLRNNEALGQAVDQQSSPKNLGPDKGKQGGVRISFTQKVGSTIETCSSQLLQWNTPYLVHIRRIAATGEVFILVNNNQSQWFHESSHYAPGWAQHDELTGNVTQATNATPIVITSNNHGRSTGEVVRITGIQGNVAANGTFVIDKINANTFALYRDHARQFPVAGSGTYTSGGAWTMNAPPPWPTKVRQSIGWKNFSSSTRVIPDDLSTWDAGQDGPYAQLTPGTLNDPDILSFGIQYNGGTSWIAPLRALVPEIFVDTELLTNARLLERKRYLRAKYGVWEGVQLDDSAAE
jgi:hypothetical protein